MTSLREISAVAFVKKYTAVPEQFVDELFDMYDVTTSQTDFVIRMSSVVKWLDSTKKVISRTLRESYTEDVDYKRIRPKDTYYKTSAKVNNYVEYMLTPDCFKRMCMMSKSKNADMVRTYFLAVEKAFFQYRQETEDGMRRTIERLERNQKGYDRSDAQGIVYVKRASHHDPKKLKIGYTKNINNRMKTYNTGEADDVEILYQYKTDYIKGVEKCVKGWLDEKRYRKYKEVYSVEADVVKRFIEGCGELGLKLMHKKRKSTLKGGYFFVFEKNQDIVN
jgi:phage anti-repressor protein